LEKRSFIILMLAISMLTLLAACDGRSSGEGVSKQGTLSGKITIGPACAAEPCGGPPGAIYMGRELILLRSGATSFKVPLGEDGSFSVEVKPADYVIRMDGCNFTGCNDAFPMETTIGAGETFAVNLDFDTGIRTAEKPPGIGVFVADLVGLGSVVAQGKSVSQPFFSVPGEETIVDGETVQVFTYASSGDAQSDADLVSPTGSPIGTSMVSWVGPTHFFLKDNLLALYVGADAKVIDRLEHVMGPQFAGFDPTSNFALPVPATGQAAKVEEYLALMDKLSLALRGVVRSTDQDDAVAQVLAVAAQLEEYVDFFGSLDEQARKELIAPYSDLISETAVTASEFAREALEATGDENIGLALQRTPAFMAGVQSRTGPSKPVVVMERAVEHDSSALLSSGEVSDLAGGTPLNVQYRDLKAKAAAVDPSQVEHIDSFAVLSFDTQDGSRGLSLTTMDFDSEAAAAEHLAMLVGPESGMQKMNDTIGDASASLEANQSGIGSVVAFKMGEWVVSLYTSHPDGDTPLINLAKLESLARTVAGRL